MYIGRLSVFTPACMEGVGREITRRCPIDCLDLACPSSTHAPVGIALRYGCSALLVACALNRQSLTLLNEEHEYGF